MKRFVFIALVLGFVFLGCDTGNNNENDEFISSTNETVSNDVATLGLIGAAVSSSNTNVVTVEITASAKIKITSVSEGTAVLTVSDASNHSVTINIRVSKTGAITIVKIEKYQPQTNKDDDNNEFISSTNETVSNDAATLGLIGTSVSSSNTNVATVEITASAKIKITSVSEGTAVLTVSDASNHRAAIDVSVSKTGVITIVKIEKYQSQTTNDNDDNNNNNNNNEFVSSTNETISNDTATLGLIGTSVSSNKTNVATVEITASAKIKITSVSEGTAVLTVSDASNHTATINVTVSKTGSITIGNIVKYTAENEDNSELPEPVGINELSGKTYETDFCKISFEEDTYTFSSIVKGGEDRKMEIFETGFYSWNTPQKAVILKKDKTDQGFGLQNKSELRESYIEYLSSMPPESLTFLSGKTIEQYADMLVEMIFSSKQTFNYKIEDGVITYFVIKTLTETETTIAGCAYSQKAATETFGIHYLLSISFDEALSILTAAYGQPDDNGALQSHSVLSDFEEDWVILEYTRYNDIRLHKNKPDEMDTITKIWSKAN
jgi:hypothetical protein